MVVKSKEREERERTYLSQACNVTKDSFEEIEARRTIPATTHLMCHATICYARLRLACCRLLAVVMQMLCYAHVCALCTHFVDTSP